MKSNVTSHPKFSLTAKTIPAKPPALAAKPLPARQDAPAVPARPAPLPSFVTPWNRIPLPDGGYMLKAGKPVIQEDEIGTAEAARIVGLSQRRVIAMCDEGVFVEGRDWRRPPGAQRAGNYKIKRAAAERIRNGGEEN